jgi:hypothetical protein
MTTAQRPRHASEWGFGCLINGRIKQLSFGTAEGQRCDVQFQAQQEPR